MQSLANFNCRTTCKHRECQRHANLGVIDQNLECECVRDDLNVSSMFLENLIDISHSLAQIMILCGIHECKAKTSVDIITYSFLHYDLVCYCLDAKPTKRLRKEDIFHELGRKCLMNRVEAHLAYTIIKRGFKAFYYRPHDEKSEKPSFSEECLYVHAAKKTAESYAQFDGLSCDEQRGVEAKIKVIYKKFYDRMQSRKAKPVSGECNCCFCTKNRGHLIYTKPPPCSVQKQQKDSPKKPHSCPHCCKRKTVRKFIHGKAIQATCPVCHRSRKFCSCAKYDFRIEWVNSIWDRPDMHLYYEENIAKVPQKPLGGCRPQGSDHDHEEDVGDTVEADEVVVDEDQDLNEDEGQIVEGEQNNEEAEDA
ncbi:uncharacterized protein LOC133330088 [Musca vetustissima]|uniref:uncharacterized protein LOC133330088 n=1 Tax=Musca vetustissima TaxID=27455 RepID=UPI002AB63917|nr:uncharacterized protein LOC133330088 [Musca vetustissima]